MTFPSLVNNGKLVAAVAALVDAVFGVLVAVGVIKEAPDAGLVVGLTTISFNALAALLAYIQHSQAVNLAKLAVSQGAKLKVA